MPPFLKPPEPALAAADTGRWIFRALLTGALLITLLRLAAPLQTQNDQAQQIEAALRFLQGHGITSTSKALPVTLDITPNPEPQPITTWPPGLSLAIAAPLACGIPAIAALKLLGSAATLLGWLAWATAFQQMAGHLSLPRSSLPRNLILVCGFIPPILLTPLWSGTDIFLWAIVPWVILLLTRSASARRPLLVVAGAGFLVGVGFSFRYAGGFLGPAGLLILLHDLWPHWKTFLIRSSVFGAASMVLAVPVISFLKSGPVMLGDVYDASLQTNEILNISAGIYHSIRLIFSSTLPELLIARLNWPVAIYAAGLLSLFTILLAPLAALRMQPRPEANLIMAMLITPAVLLVFLAAVSRGFFLGVSRYYEPAQMCWLLAMLPLLRNGGAVGWAARLLTALFAIQLLTVPPLRALTPEGRASMTRIVAGFSPSRSSHLNSTSAPVPFFDPSRLFCLRETTKKKLNELHRQQPHALIWVDNYPMYIYDGWPGGPPLGSTLRILPPLRYLLKAYTPEKRKLFVVLERANRREFSGIAWPGRVVFQDKWEETEILEIELEPGEPILRLPNPATPIQEAR